MDSGKTLTQVKNGETPDENHALLPPIDVIKAVVSTSASRGATHSLLFWGVINLGAWLLLESNYRSTLLSLPNPGIEIYFLAYSGALIGGLMLSFALLGFVTRHSSIVLLNGLSLLGVGLWNIFGDFFAVSALKPYGYTIEPGTMPLWILLGILQTVWGGRGINRYFSSRQRHDGIEKSEVKRAEEILKNLVKEKPSLETGVLELTTSSSGWLLFHQPRTYSARLMLEQAICIRKDLGDFFVIEKKTAHQLKWQTNSVVELIDEAGKKRRVVFADSSFEIFKTWTSIFSEAYREPTILSSTCTLNTMALRIKHLLLTSSRLVIRTPDGSEQDICIPLSSIMKWEVTKHMGQKTLSIHTNEEKYRLHYVKNAEEWAAKLDQLQRTSKKD